MKITYFKLVPVSCGAEIKDGEPYVAVTGEVNCFTAQRPDWARHILEGSAGIFNTDNLIKKYNETI